MSLCKYHRLNRKADIKRKTGYCKKKDINLRPNQCESCNDGEMFNLFNTDIPTKTEKGK